MTADSPAEQVAEAIRAFFAEHEVATLRLPSGWFGRPYDNWHQLTEAAVDGARVLVLLDETQRLSIDASAAAVDGRILRIAIRGGNWQWTSYGASDRYEQLLDEGVVEFHAPYHR